MTALFDILVDDFVAQATAGRKLVTHTARSKAFIPGGHNGPHYALETPVRNTCHWISTFVIADQLQPGRNHIEYAHLLVNWLLDSNPHSRSGVYVQRQSGGRDWCNGVIGPAWTIEALARYVRTTQEARAAEHLARLVGLHPFDSKYRAWQRNDPSGIHNGIDGTLDHQAWLACAMQAAGNDSCTLAFLDGLADGGLSTTNGRIDHILRFGGMKGLAVKALYLHSRTLRQKRMEDIENGYHIYTMLPIACLERVYSNHRLFSGAAWKKARAWLTLDNLSRITHSEFGFFYNAPGFELPTLWLLRHDDIPLDEVDVMAIWQQQRDKTYDPFTGLHTLGSPDSITLASRIYELGIGLEQARSESPACAAS